MKTLFIEPGSPWENGYIESFNEKLRCAPGRPRSGRMPTLEEGRLLHFTCESEPSTGCGVS